MVLVSIVNGIGVYCLWPWPVLSNTWWALSMVDLVQGPWLALSMALVGIVHGFGWYYCPWLWLVLSMALVGIIHGFGWLALSMALVGIIQGFDWHFHGLGLHCPFGWHYPRLWLALSMVLIGIFHGLGWHYPWLWLALSKALVGIIQGFGWHCP